MLAALVAAARAVVAMAVVRAAAVKAEVVTAVKRGGTRWTGDPRYEKKQSHLQFLWRSVYRPAHTRALLLGRNQLSKAVPMITSFFKAKPAAGDAAAASSSNTAASVEESKTPAKENERPVTTEGGTKRIGLAAEEQGSPQDDLVVVDPKTSGAATHTPPCPSHLTPPPPNTGLV